MYLLIVFFPLLGSSVAGFFGRFHIVIVAAFSLNSVTVNEKMKPHWIIFLTKPLVRLSFAYFYFLFLYIYICAIHHDLIYRLIPHKGFNNIFLSILRIMM